MNEADILLMLERKHPAPAWAFFSHVASGTGGFAARTADAVAMSLWPSRGLDVYGFEVKTERRDWLRELKDPEKAERIAKHCDYWFLVTTPGVVQDGEVPPRWGHYEVRGRRLYIKKSARASARSKTISRVFVASLMRKAHDKQMNQAERKAIRDEGFEAGKSQGEMQADYSKRDHHRLKVQVAAFEKASGVSLQDGYADGEDIGKAVSIVRDGGVADIKGDLERILVSSRQITNAIEHNLKGLKEAT